MTWQRSLSSCSFLLLLSGCNSTGVGNPAPALSLSLAIVNDESPVEELSEAGMGGAVDTAVEAGAGATDMAGAAGEPSAVGAPSTSEILPLRAVKDAIIVFGELRFLPC